MGLFDGLGQYLGFGKPGSNAGNSIQNNAGYQNINKAASDAAGNSDLQGALSQINNPNTSSKYATDQVQGNSLFSGMFGKGGYQDQLQNEHQNLSQNGYSLTPQDHEAYGQASDNAARMFGQEGNQVSAQLASHGLAAGGSGGAGVAFSGLAGNQNEQLAQAQRSIASDRMNMNLQRLNSVRGAITNTQAQAQSALGQQENQNQRGVDNYNNLQQSALNAGEANQNQENNQWQQTQSSTSPTFGSMLGGSLTHVLGGAAGGLGSAAGSKISPTDNGQNGKLGMDQLTSGGSGGGAGGGGLKMAP